MIGLEIVEIYYYAMKFFIFFAIVRSLVKFEPLQRHVLFLGLLYTGIVTFLSYVFIVGPMEIVPWGMWELWLAKTFLLATSYFWLLVRYDEGIVFWILIMLGVAVVLF